MKIQIEGEPKEIAELLQAIEGSEEQHKEITLKLDNNVIGQKVPCLIRDTQWFQDSV